MSLLQESWVVAKRDLQKHFSIVKEFFMIVITASLILAIGVGISKLNNSSTYTGFFSAGMLGYLIALLAILVGTQLVIDKKGFNKILLVAPISRLSILIGKAIYLTITTLKTYIIISIIFMIYLGTFTFARMGLVILVAIMILSTFLGITFIAAALLDKKGIEIFQTTISMMLLLFSGAIYSIKLLPDVLQKISYLNPGLYTNELLRYAITGASESNILLFTAIVVILAITLPSLGVYLYDKKLRDG